MVLNEGKKTSMGLLCIEEKNIVVYIPTLYNMEMHKVWLIKCAHLLIKNYYLYNNLIIMKLKIYLICFWKQSN